MCPNSKFLADLVTFTEKIQNGKLHFLCSEGPEYGSTICIKNKLKSLFFLTCLRTRLWKNATLQIYKNIEGISNTRCLKMHTYVSRGS